MNSPAEIDSPAPIRLSILHLLMWTTGSALLATYLRDFPADRFEGTLGAVLLGMQLTYAVIGGLGIASVGMLFQYGFRQNARFPREPGHWLLLASGVGSLAGLAAYGIATFYEFSNMGRASLRLGFHELASAGVLLAGLASVRGRFWGRILLIETVIAVCVGISIVIYLQPGFLRTPDDTFHLFRYVFHWNSMILGFVLLVRSVIEGCTSPRPHDWLHRVALCAFVIAGCNSAAAYFILPLLKN